MRKLLLAVVALCICYASPAFAGPTYPTRPPNAGLVNDFANVIPDDQEVALERDLRAFERKYHAEIAVVSITSMNGYSVEDYANGLFRAWGIGKRGADNGVLLLVSTSDRKARIEVGYRLEPVLTDDDASAIIRNSMHDQFHRNDFGGGLVSGAHAVMDFFAQALPSENQQIMSKATTHKATGGFFSTWWFIALLVFCPLLLIVVLIWNRARRRAQEIESRAEINRYRRASFEPIDTGVAEAASRRSRTASASPYIAPSPSPEPARRRDEDDSSSDFGRSLGTSFGSSFGSDSSFGSSSSDSSSGFDFGGGSSGGGGSSDSF